MNAAEGGTSSAEVGARERLRGTAACVFGAEGGHLEVLSGRARTAARRAASKDTGDDTGEGVF